MGQQRTTSDNSGTGLPLPCDGQCVQGYCVQDLCFCGDVFTGTHCEYVQMHLATQHVGVTSIALNWSNYTLDLSDFVALVYKEEIQTNCNMSSACVSSMNLQTTDNVTFTVGGLNENGKTHFICIEHYEAVDGSRAILGNGPNLAMKQRCIWVETGENIAFVNQQTSYNIWLGNHSIITCKGRRRLDSYSAFMLWLRWLYRFNWLSMRMQLKFCIVIKTMWVLLSLVLIKTKDNKTHIVLITIQNCKVRGQTTRDP